MPVSAREVTTVLRQEGYRPLAAGPITVAWQPLSQRVKVCASHDNRTFACLTAEEMAQALQKRGYQVEAEESKTFFFVLGYAEEGDQ